MNLTESLEPEDDHIQEPDYYFCMCCGTQTGGHAYSRYSNDAQFNCNYCGFQSTIELRGWI